MKKLLALLLALVMVFGMVACSESAEVNAPKDGKTAANGTAAPEAPKEDKPDAQAMATKFADGIFTPDVQAMFDLLPFDAAVEQLEGEDKAALEEEIDLMIEEGQASLDAIYGGLDLKWSVKLVSEEALGEEELASLNESYSEVELTVEKAYSAVATYTVTYEGVDVSADVELVFVKIDGAWYLDVDSLNIVDELDVVPEEESAFDAEYMVNSFVDYLLTPDMASLMGMMPPVLMETMLAEMGGDYEAAIEMANEAIREAYALAEGVEITYDIEIIAEEELTEEELAELNAVYALLADVEFDSAIGVNFTINLAAMGEELPVEMALVFVEQDGEWYVDATSFENALVF